MLSVSPELAATLGLEEALLVQLLQEINLLHATAEISFSSEQRLRLLPFWSDTQLTAVLRRLEAQGLVELIAESPWKIRLLATDDAASATSIPGAALARNVPASELTAMPIFAMNEARQRNQADDDLAYLRKSSSTRLPVKIRKRRMHEHWEPSDDFPALLAFHDIPLNFALSELLKFRQYFLKHDRMEVNWDVRFLTWVQRAWHDSLNTQGHYERTQTADDNSANSARGARAKVRDALRNIEDTDW